VHLEGERRVLAPKKGGVMLGKRPEAVGLAAWESAWAVDLLVRLVLEREVVSASESDWAVEQVQTLAAGC